MFSFSLTISKSDIYSVLDHKWFVKTYLIDYKLHIHDIFYYFLEFTQSKKTLY